MERISVGDQLWVLAVTGELDLSNSNELRAGLASLIDGESARWVALDLLGIDFLDSTALAAVAHAHRRLQATHGAITIVCQAYVCETFERTGLGDIFGLHLTRDHAVGYLTGLRAAA
jgi:anti-anti-sigma factor